VDILGLIALAESVVAAEQNIIAQGKALAVGKEMKVYIPNATAVNALLVKGEAGARYRIEGFVIKREA
jgi:hypothetical protein